MLDTYQPERAPIGARVLRFTDRAFTIATSTNPVVRFARTRIAPILIPLLLKSRIGRAYAFRTVSQLRIHYRHSPLSTNGPHPPPRTGPAAGDRLPDTAIVHNGQTTTLHRLVAGPGWHLLLCGPPDTWPAAQSTDLAHRYQGIVVPHHLAGPLPALGIDQDGVAQYLIRPDGHVGYRATGADLTGLRAYFTRWLTPPAGTGPTSS